MKLLLQNNSLNIRGCTAATYDYAINLKNNHNVECIITYDLSQKDNDKRILNKFQKEFEVIGYNSFSEIDNIIKSNHIDSLYMMKSGKRDNKLTQLVPNLVHAVFALDMSDRDVHGEKFAFISQWLSNDFANRYNVQCPYVPYMLNLPNNTHDDYRSLLKIDNDKIVIGRYGGLDCFDIPFVVPTIQKILNERTEIVFLFCNTPKFIDHPNVIFTNSLASLNEKVKFLNTCDAFLHARYRGETFGLAVLEFMSRSLPVFTYGNSIEQNHLSLLDGKGLIYNSAEDLFELILNFQKHKIVYKTLMNYTPEVVTKRFVDVFLK